jgi:hypothetical protein
MPPLTDTEGIIEGELYRYRFVGSGAQFRAYGVYTYDSRPTGRVIKVPLDYEETRRAIIGPLRELNKHRDEDHFKKLAEERTREIMQYKYDVPNLMQGILGRDTHFMRQLGGLKILQMPVPAASQDGTATYFLPTLFTQDYVMTLDEYLQQFRLASNPYVRTLDARSIDTLKVVLDQVVQLNFAIWEYGIFEFVFKPENFGIRVTEQGQPKLIWMDLAEHITDLKQAEVILAERRWSHALMPHKVDYQFMPSVLHEYYTEVCNKALTIEALRKKWRKKCIHAEASERRKLRIKEAVTGDGKKTVALWVARHSLSNSLYSGFDERNVDDLQIPPSDIKLLINDKFRAGMEKATSMEERMERRMAEAGMRDMPHIFPTIMPPRISSKERL